MSEQTEKKSLKTQLEEEMVPWQAKMDVAKLQLHLGAKDLQDVLQPHADKLEQELEEAKRQWQHMEEASGNSMKDIEEGLQVSFTAMKKSFEKAKMHFIEEDKPSK